MELISIMGLRMDGRLPSELRTTKAQVSFHPSSDGSCIFEMGNTKVSCTVSGPRELRSFSNSSNIAVNVFFAPFASKSSSSKKAFEIGHVISNALQSTLHDLSKSGVSIRVLVLSSDGSLLACCLNACILALIDAGVPMKDFLIGVSCCVGDGEILLDPNLQEISHSSCEIFSAYMGRSKKISAMKVEGKINKEKLNEVNEVLKNGSENIFLFMNSLAIGLNKNKMDDDDGEEMDEWKEANLYVDREEEEGEDDDE